jgi:predicted phosphohydrolase
LNGYIEMTKLIWCSDIHLNFLSKNPEHRNEFYISLRDSEGDNILITGDIAESHNIEMYLEELALSTGKRIYFVAGNHDFYGSSLKEVRAKLKKNIHAHYLPKSWGVKLNRHTVLIGQDSWGDCRNGDYENSQRGFGGFVMSDWLYISELNKAYLGGSDKLRIALQLIADKDAQRLCKSVLKALQDKNVTKIIIATHVPPIVEACLHAGRKSTPSGLCFFSSQILGASMLPIIENNPNIDFLWLSGHTHSKVKVQKRDNLVVQVAHSEYYHPQIADIIEC